jgi:hypothetical protein
MLTALLYLILVPLGIQLLITVGPLVLLLLLRFLSGWGGVLVMFIILLLTAGK